MACYNYDLFISGLDTVEATGNTSFIDYEVYIGYQDCTLGPQTINLGSGTYGNAICADDNFPITFTYYQDNIGYQAIYSFPTQQGPCGTPTPTPAVTNTPTPTNPAGCFSLTYIGFTTSSACSGAQLDITEQWRFTYLNGTVNQNVSLDYEYDFADGCPSGPSYTTSGSVTMNQGNSTVDFYVVTSQYDDCGFGPPSCYLTTRTLTGKYGSSVSCATLATTPTPTITSSPTPTPTTPATMFSRSSSDYANEYFACLGSVSGIDFLYQTPGAGGGISPAVSAQMFTNPGLTNTWGPAGSGWYLLEYYGTFYAVLPNSNGVLQTVYLCGTLPSQTPTNTSTPTPTKTPTQTPTATPFTQYKSATT